MEHEATGKCNIVDHSGSQHEINLSLQDYRAAAEDNLSLTQYLQNKYPSDMRQGTTMEQCMQSAGMFIKHDPATGLTPPTMKSVLDGGFHINAGAISRNDGSSNNTITGRLLFPEVIMQMIQSQLTESKDDFLNGFNSMVATTAFVNSPKIDQPVINVTAPEGSRNQPIAQMAEPAIMVSISLSDKSMRVPTKAIGLQISDEALQASTLDLVGLAMTSQARGERISMVETQLAGMLNGDVDSGEASLSGVTTTAAFFDAAIIANNALTHKAWVKFLRYHYRKMTVTDIICDIDSALLIEGRTGKPTINTDDPNSPRIDALFSLQNLGITAPRILLVDTATIGAGVIVGLDRRHAIRRIVNVSASYSAIEQYVMRRVTSFRVDYGELSHKLMPDAWTKMTLTV